MLLWIFSPGGSALLFLGPTAAFLLGWGISADVAYDGSAFWTHLAAPVHRAHRPARPRARAPRSSRCRSSIVYVVGSALLTDRPDAIPALLGVSFGVLCTAFGGASIVSALVVYPVQQPGDNPFQTRQGASMVAVTSQLVGWSAVLALSAARGGPGVHRDLAARRRRWAGRRSSSGRCSVGSCSFVGAARRAGATLERNGADLLRRIMAFA